MKETKNILVCDYCASLVKDPDYDLAQKDHFTDEVARKFQHLVKDKRAQLAKSGWHFTGKVEWARRLWAHGEWCDICRSHERGNRWWAIAERNIYSQ